MKKIIAVTLMTTILTLSLFGCQAQNDEETTTTETESTSETAYEENTGDTMPENSSEETTQQESQEQSTATPNPKPQQQSQPKPTQPATQQQTQPQQTPKPTQPNNNTNNEKSKTVQIGEYITFGSYEQDGYISNGKEPIQWLVLDIQNGKAFVVSRYLLYYDYYGKKHVYCSWDGSYIRDWLNNEFLNDAFTDKEKSKIPTVTVKTDPNPLFDTFPGVPTQDKIFLLSAEEAKNYFSSDDKRVCEPTQYAIKMYNDYYEKRIIRGLDVPGHPVGANHYVINSQELGFRPDFYWLRSPGEEYDNGSSLNAVHVNCDGRIYYKGFQSFDRNYGSEGWNFIRPAMWIDLS